MFKKIPLFNKRKPGDRTPQASDQASVTSQWVAPESEPSTDKILQRKIIEALKMPSFTGSEVLQMKGDEAQRAFRVMKQLVDDPAFWKSAIRKHPDIDRWLVPPLMVKLAQESGQLPDAIRVEVESAESDCIADGGFGEVYLGKYKGRKVAIKRLRVYRSMSAEERAQVAWDISRESLMLHHLHHPSLLEFIGIDLSHSLRPGLVTPWMDYGSIMNYMDNMQIDPPAHQKDKWLQEIAHGVQYLHEATVVHGDLKGANVLVAENGQMKISDFGLTVFEGDWSKEFGSQHGGNVHWTAPENMWIHTGQYQRPTYASDIYSFAMVCIEVYTRMRPFQAIKTNNQRNLAALINSGKRPSIPHQMSKELSSHLVTWWHGSPQQRPPIQYIVEFFNYPTKLAQEQMRLESSAVLPTITQKQNFAQELVNLLCKIFNKDAEFLALCSRIQPSAPSIRYPNCPLHIIIDEAALIAGLYKICNGNMNLAAQFSYPTLQFILERGRTVTSRLLFTALEKMTSQSTLPLQNLGYNLNEICNISSYGILVFFAGGEESWLDDSKFAKYLHFASQNGWQVEVFAWNNTMTEKMAWYDAIPGANGPNSSCIIFLETFYTSLFSF
ncbi:unnamed protein product [Somion occarium]|uniref:Protein kinase domain-containing protein n=1 Tax=Somion occarium TaxID=3059160 RepID=A0ABP1CGW5_9APHY